MLKIIKYNLKRIDSVYVFTTEKYDNLINDLFDLSIIPQDYSKKIVYFSGEPLSWFAIKIGHPAHTGDA